WRTLSESEALDVIRACGHPVRRIILALLETKPMRKSDIAKYIHRFLGKKHSRSLIQHHLKLLERAGLVGYMEDPVSTSKTKLAYLAARTRIQIKPEPKPESFDLFAKDLVEMELWQRFKEQISKERQPPAL
ncbi:MAG: ArsR family transcriptional regulator, partial [Hadesarchaea archaeon]|nr:ArsR family transcriptional regulator [Hadesarchaea archaeon]